MAIREIVKISRKTFFYPTAWLGYNALKAQTQSLWSICKGLLIIPRPASAHSQENFNEAMHRQNLTDQDLRTTLFYYCCYTWLFISMGILVNFFGFYLLFHHSTFHGWILALGASILFFAQAFKYDFWVFQIKQRKLGCTWQEWKNYRWHRK